MLDLTLRSNIHVRSQLAGGGSPSTSRCAAYCRGERGGPLPLSLSLSPSLSLPFFLWNDYFCNAKRAMAAGRVQMKTNGAALAAYRTGALWQLSARLK